MTQYSLKIMYGELELDEGFEMMVRELEAKGLFEKVKAYQEWLDSKNK